MGVASPFPVQMQRQVCTVLLLVQCLLDLTARRMACGAILSFFRYNGFIQSYTYAKMGLYCPAGEPMPPGPYFQAFNNYSLPVLPDATPKAWSTVTDGCSFVFNLYYALQALPWSLCSFPQPGLFKAFNNDSLLVLPDATLKASSFYRQLFL